MKHLLNADLPYKVNTYVVAQFITSLTFRRGEVPSPVQTRRIRLIRYKSQRTTDGPAEMQSQ